MHDPIILTLDGSNLAEAAVPHAVDLARRLGSRLVLLRVVTPAPGPAELAFGPTSYDHRQLLQAEEAAARAYVEAKVRELSAQNVRVEGLVREGEPASTIVDYAAESGARLVVLATHGRSGVARWVYGSVADRVLRAATVPVLLLRSRT
jgi:nucleotide-binding universal stress UspA family protein